MEAKIHSEAWLESAVGEGAVQGLPIADHHVARPQTIGTASFSRSLFESLTSDLMSSFRDDAAGRPRHRSQQYFHRAVP